MSDANKTLVSSRIREGLADLIDAEADDHGVTRSALIEQYLEFAVEAAGGQVAERERAKRDVSDIINENETVRNIVPGKWRSHVRGLFRDDIKDGCSPRDLRILADRYREQARANERLAETFDDLDQPDLEGIVDEELYHALEAEDRSEFYATRDNPHESLSGVAEGTRKRKLAITVIQGVVEAQNQTAAALESDAAPRVRPDELRVSESELPAGVDRETIADAANRLVANGAESQDVPELLNHGDDPALRPDSVDSVLEDDAGPDPDPDETETETDQPATPDVPAPDAVEQSELPMRIPASDGGRSAAARATGWTNDDAFEAAGWDGDANGADDPPADDSVREIEEWIIDESSDDQPDDADVEDPTMSDSTPYETDAETDESPDDTSGSAGGAADE